MQEWSNCTEWFFDAYGDKIRRFALSLLLKNSSPQIGNDAEDLASDIMITIRSEWDRGVLLNAYIENCKNNAEKDISTLFRTYLMGRIRCRIIDAIRRGKVEPNIDVSEVDIEQPRSDDENWDNELRDLLIGIVEGSPQDALARWRKRLSQSLGNKAKRQLNFWLAPETLALKDDIAAKVAIYPDELRENRKPRSIEKEWQRRALEPIILRGYDELRNGIPAPQSQIYSCELIAKAIAVTLIRVDILVSWEYVLRVILRSLGLEGEVE